MFGFLPGTTELRAIVRKVDTARHNGVPDGCVLELDLQAMPPETTGFDPMALISAGGKRSPCVRPSPPSTVPRRTIGWPV